MADYREIVSPGDAFTQDFNGFMLQQAALKRQALLDEVASKRESRLEEADKLDNEIRRQQLQQKIQEDKEREALNFVNRYQKSHVSGDIPDAGTLAKSKELGVEDMFREDTSKAVAPPPSQSVDLPGAVAPGGPPPPGMAAPPTAPPAAIRLAPSPSEAGLKGPQTYPGSAKEQETAQQQVHAKALLDTLPEGPEKEGLKFWLATGKEPPAGLLTSKGQKQPELGTFGDYLYTLSDGHPEKLTAAQKESALKKWHEIERAPQSPINLYTMGPGGQLSAPTQIPHGSQVRNLPQGRVSASDISKLTPAQLVVFKDAIKRGEAQAEGFLPGIFGSSVNEEVRAKIEQDAMAEALAVGGKPGAAPAGGSTDPAAQAILDKVLKR